MGARCALRSLPTAVGSLGRLSLHPTRTVDDGRCILSHSALGSLHLALGSLRGVNLVNRHGIVHKGVVLRANRVLSSSKILGSMLLLVIEI